ncbi:MAG: bifunctional DNA primase/polymerase, partial [Planctomycetota bacterium]
MTITREIALKYHKAGFHVVPVGQDKRPLCKWKQYQTAQTAKDVQRLWQSPSWGIAAITGINGLECIDVDEKYDVNGDLFLRYQRMNDKYSDGSIAFPYLTVCSTMNGGYHIFYRCDAVQGNQKLAMRPATTEEMDKHNASATNKLDNPNRLPQVLIETRGEGGYVLITPTPGYSVEYGAMKSIPEITQEQRYNLLMNARRFDEVEVPASEIDIQAKKQAIQSGKAPWDDYNEKQDITSLLESYGWSVVYEDSARVHMLRPGDSSTKTSGNYHKQHNLFRCHSTSTCLPPDKSLTASAIYTYYEHGGDFKAATKELASQGFGDQQVSTLTVDDLLSDNTEAKQEQKKQAEDLLAFVKSTKFDIRQPIKEEDAILTSTVFGKQYKLAGKGMIAGVVGAQKSGKTLITSCFVASALSGKQKLTFDMDLQGK